jgi:hypothetical protein
MGIEGKQVQAKGTKNIFNKIIENSKLEEAMFIQVQEAFRIPNRQDQKKPPYIIQ